MKLMIVESPNKVKKIKSFLGDDWRVSASVGHIRDLPDREMGFTPPDFRPQYVISPDKKKVVSELKKQAAAASEVYLATDPDREGEAIAWHLKSALGLKSHQRVTFNEISKNAISKALQSARQIDVNLVTAQEGRRVLDRIVGYIVSPILSKQAGIPLSGGRVQSPAVKLVVMKEREIQKFRKRNFYTVEIELANGLTATLNPAGWCEDNKHIFDKEVAEEIAAIESVLTTKVSIEPKSVKPKSPFTTSTLQQAASSILKMSPNDTMKNAQALFEQGAISYHRTDSPNLSPESFSVLRQFMHDAGFDTQESQLTWQAKAGAQEGHEAIRPTHAEDEVAGETDKQRQLYALIRERTLTSVLNPAIDTVTSIEFISTDEIEVKGKVSQAKFSVSGKVEKYPGWRVFPKIEKVGTPSDQLPVLVDEGSEHSVKTTILTKTTEPPSRFTEADLIKALEKLGIGRPSTYASILENIKKRDYIEINKERKIQPTTIGFAICDALDAMTFMNLQYTKILEDQLDLIASGKSTYKKLVSSLYETVTEESQRIKIERLVASKPCPVCGEPVERHKSSKTNGYFWVHINEETSCHKFLSDLKGEPVIQEKKSSQSVKSAPCPNCQKELKQLTKNESKFWVHINEADSKDCQRFISDDNGKPHIKK